MSNLFITVLRSSVALLILLSAFSSSYWEWHYKIPCCNCELVLFFVLMVSFCFCIFETILSPCTFRILHLLVGITSILFLWNVWFGFPQGRSSPCPYSPMEASQWRSGVCVNTPPWQALNHLMSQGQLLPSRWKLVCQQVPLGRSGPKMCPPFAFFPPPILATQVLAALVALIPEPP